MGKTARRWPTRFGSPASGDPAMTRSFHLTIATAAPCRNRRLSIRPEPESAANPQTLDERLVAGFVVLLHVVKERATLRDHL